MVNIPGLGWNLYIGPKGPTAPPDSPDPWIKVDELAEFGEVAFNTNEIRSEALSRVDDELHKGVNQTPIVPVRWNKNSGGDEGQDAMEEAYDDRSQDQEYWFKLEGPDAPDGSPAGTPTTAIFKAKVFSFIPFGQINVGGVIGGGASLAIRRATFTVNEAAEAS